MNEELILEINNRQKQKMKPHEYDNIQSRFQTTMTAAKNILTNTKLDLATRSAKNSLLKTIRGYKRGTTPGHRVYKELKDTLTELHRRAYLLGMQSSGRAKAVPAEEEKWLKKSIQHENAFLKSFVKDTLSGKERDPEQRILNYLPAVQAHYMSARQINMPYNTLIYWRLEKRDKGNCKTCPWLAQNGPYTKDTLPFFPRSGGTNCVHNCRCQIIYKHEPDIQNVLVVQRKHGSVDQVLKKMKRAGVIK